MCVGGIGRGGDNINIETMQHYETRPTKSPVLYVKDGYEATVRFSTSRWKISRLVCVKLVLGKFILIMRG